MASVSILFCVLLRASRPDVQVNSLMTNTILVGRNVFEFVDETLSYHLWKFGHIAITHS